MFIQTSSEKEKDLSVFPKSNVYGLYVFKCCQFLSCKTTWAKPKQQRSVSPQLFIFTHLQLSNFCKHITVVGFNLFLWCLCCWCEPSVIATHFCRELCANMGLFFYHGDLNIVDTVGLTPWQKFTAYALFFFVWTVLSVACLKFLLNLASNKLKKKNTVQYSCVKNNATVFYKYMYIGMYILHLYLLVAF